MNILCIGAGPAGLLFAIVMKLSRSDYEVEVYERLGEGETVGWGLILPEPLLVKLAAYDLSLVDDLRRHMVYWQEISVSVGRCEQRIKGHQFNSLARLTLLELLKERAMALGVKIFYNSRTDPVFSLKKKPDLIVVADGANSAFRKAHAQRFGSQVEVRPNKFIWLGTRAKFDRTFKFAFEHTQAGWIWAHGYEFSESTSTFVVECSHQTWTSLGFDVLSLQDSVSVCEAIFQKHLAGQPLLLSDAGRSASRWSNYVIPSSTIWHFDNVVLLGNAAHATHFSVGSGTRLAFEDALVLADELLRSDSAIPEALARYQEIRQGESQTLHGAAWHSMCWFETVDQHIDRPLELFSYALLNRAGGFPHYHLLDKDESWVRSVERCFLKQVATNTRPVTAGVTGPPSLDDALGERCIFHPLNAHAAHRLSYLALPYEQDPESCFSAITQALETSGTSGILLAVELSSFHENSRSFELLMLAIGGAYGAGSVIVDFVFSSELNDQCTEQTHKFNTLVEVVTNFLPGARVSIQIDRVIASKFADDFILEVLQNGLASVLHLSSSCLSEDRFSPLMGCKEIQRIVDLPCFNSELATSYILSGKADYINFKVGAEYELC